MIKFKTIGKRIIAAGSAILVIMSSITYANASDTTQYKFPDISLEVSVNDDLVCFTRNVTSNYSNLDLIGVENVEELRALMNVNNVYFEAVPKDVAYEIIINGKDADSQIKDFNNTSEDELKNQFESYFKACDGIATDAVTETVTASSIYKNDTTTYFVTNVKSVSNNYVTVYIKKYYTVMKGKVITFSIQSNSQEISSDMDKQIISIVDSAQYKEIKAALLDDPFISEILSTIITLIVPIAVLGIIVFFLIKSQKKR